MRVEIWSDIVCPWCYIGERRFARGLAGFEHRDEVEVVYRSFELDPSTPKGRGTPVLDLLAAKYGLTRAEAEQAEARVAALAEADDLGFTADREAGNTFDAHRLVHLGRERGVQGPVLRGIYHAYFAEGRPVFDLATLTGVAAEAGLDPGDAKQALEDGSYGDAVRADEDQARALGITGVPFYVVDGKYGISGAQPAEAFTQALRQVRAS
jgi:predicted DsbA family dithiol-disulfide isomerase